MMFYCLGFSRGLVVARVVAARAIFGNFSVDLGVFHFADVSFIFDRLQSFVHIFVEHLPSPLGTVIISILA